MHARLSGARGASYLCLELTEVELTEGYLGAFVWLLVPGVMPCLLHRHVAVLRVR